MSTTAVGEVATIRQALPYWLRLSRPAWVGGAAAMVIAITATRVLTDGADDEAGMVHTARTAGMVLAVAVAAPLLDLAYPVLDATPYPRLARRLAPTLLALVAIAACWVGLVTVLIARSATLPFAALTLEVAAAALVAAAAGAWCRGLDPGLAAAAVIAALVVVDETSVRFLTAPPGPHWARAHAAWAAALLLSAVLLMAGLHDPARRHRYARCRAATDITILDRH